MLRFLFFEILFLGSCGYALWRGGLPERIAAATFLLAATLTMFLRQTTLSFIPPDVSLLFRRIEIPVSIVDAAVLGAMLWLSIVSERFWPLWMAAMAGIIVLTHTSMLLGLREIPWAYWNAQALWSYPMQLLLGVATWRHRQRLKRFGADPSWRLSSRR